MFSLEAPRGQLDALEHVGALDDRVHARRVGPGQDAPAEAVPAGDEGAAAVGGEEAVFPARRSRRRDVRRNARSLHQKADSGQDRDGSARLARDYSRSRGLSAALALSSVSLLEELA